MVTVVNARTVNYETLPPNSAAVYIGRGHSKQTASPLGNPFKLTKGESRDDCLAKYTEWLSRKLLQDTEQRRELKRLRDIHMTSDLYLVCWCAPKQCHGDIIKELIESERSE